MQLVPGGDHDPSVGRLQVFERAKLVDGVVVFSLKQSTQIDSGSMERRRALSSLVSRPEVADERATALAELSLVALERKHLFLFEVFLG